MSYTIFDYIDSILFSKKYIDDVPENDSTFSTYMLNRWISMYSIEMAELINGCNNYSFNLSTKQEQYDYLFNLIPKVRRKRISYIKKLKKETKNEKESDEIKFLAKNLELSQKEVKEGIDFLLKLHN